MARIGVKVEVTEEGTVQKEFGERKILPKGDYELEIIASDVIQKNEGTPEHSVMVKATMCVREPEEYRGAWIFTNYNLVNKNLEAREIGNKDFQKLLRALEFSRFNEDDDTEELHFRPFMAKVGLGKDSAEKNAEGKPKYPARPEVKWYYFPTDENGKPTPLPPPSVSAEPAATTPANDNRTSTPAARPAAAATTAGKPSWMNKGK